MQTSKFTSPQQIFLSGYAHKIHSTLRMCAIEWKPSTVQLEEDNFKTFWTAAYSLTYNFSKTLMGIT